MTEFLAFIESLLGTYTPNTYTDVVYHMDGTYQTVSRIAEGLAGVDIAYIMRGVIFLVAFVCTMKLLGGILCRNL